MKGYIPDEEELAGCYAFHMKEHAGELYEVALADGKRGVAQIRADALRDAATKILATRGYGLALGPDEDTGDIGKDASKVVSDWLEHQADLLEQGTP